MEWFVRRAVAMLIAEPMDDGRECSNADVFELETVEMAA
jgi:hypothetical protein